MKKNSFQNTSGQIYRKTMLSNEHVTRWSVKNKAEQK